MKTRLSSFVTSIATFSTIFLLISTSAGSENYKYTFKQDCCPAACRNDYSSCNETDLYEQCVTQCYRNFQYKDCDWNPYPTDCCWGPCSSKYLQKWGPLVDSCCIESDERGMVYYGGYCPPKNLSTSIPTVSPTISKKPICPTTIPPTTFPTPFSTRPRLRCQCRWFQFLCRLRCLFGI
jgi:hypothetical protein